MLGGTGRMNTVRIDFLWFEDCPSHTAARAMLSDVLAQQEVEAEIVETRVQTQARAEALAFPGSPTIRVNGLDIDEDGAGSRPALTCRAYQWSDGRIQPLPERARLAAAVREASAAKLSA